jgi:cytochrome P450
MSLDESIYCNPTAFYPERYLPKPGGNGEPHFSAKFGFGRRYLRMSCVYPRPLTKQRRICTGQYFAENSLWIAIATVLAACTITNAVDEDGNLNVPDAIMSYGLGRYVVRVECYSFRVHHFEEATRMNISAF